MRKYEVMYIIRPNIDEESKKAVIERFNNVLTSNGAEITGTKDWVNVVLLTKSTISATVSTKS